MVFPLDLKKTLCYFWIDTDLGALLFILLVSFISSKSKDSYCYLLTFA